MPPSLLLAVIAAADTSTCRLIKHSGTRVPEIVSKSNIVGPSLQALQTQDNGHEQAQARSNGEVIHQHFQKFLAAYASEQGKVCFTMLT